MELLVKDIHYDTRFNCRGAITPASVVPLANLIESEGLINPITVRTGKAAKIEMPYHLIAGHRRFIAVRDVLKRPSIEAVLVDPCTNKAAHKINLLENLGREQLSIGQEIQAIERVFGKDADPSEVAKTLGVTQRWATARVKARQLDPTVFKAVMASKINATDILLLLTFPVEGQTSVLHDILKAKQSQEVGLLRRNNRGRLSRKKVLNMMTTILDSGTTPTWARALAWAAGNITDEELLTPDE